MTAGDWLWYVTLPLLVLTVLTLAALAWSAERAIRDLRYRVSELEWAWTVQHDRINKLTELLQ
jgi:hypothetical protein